MRKSTRKDSWWVTWKLFDDHNEQIRWCQITLVTLWENSDKGSCSYYYHGLKSWKKKHCKKWFGPQSLHLWQHTNTQKGCGSALTPNGTFMRWIIQVFTQSMEKDANSFTDNLIQRSEKMTIHVPNTLRRETKRKSWNNFSRCYKFLLLHLYRVKWSVVSWVQETTTWAKSSLSFL